MYLFFFSTRTFADSECTTVSLDIDVWTVGIICCHYKLVEEQAVALHRQEGKDSFLHYQSVKF